MDGDLSVAQATADTLNLEVPEPPALDTAIESSRRYAGFRAHIFPGCLVCGPERGPGDGLRIFPEGVDGWQVVAAPWVPGPSLAGADGMIDRRHVSAALDCPSCFGLGAGPPALLGGLTASIERLPRVGERPVAIGWPRDVEGRKHHRCRHRPIPKAISRPGPRPSG